MILIEEWFLAAEPSKCFFGFTTPTSIDDENWNEISCQLYAQMLGWTE